MNYSEGTEKRSPTVIVGVGHTNQHPEPQQQALAGLVLGSYRSFEGQPAANGEHFVKG